MATKALAAWGDEDGVYLRRFELDIPAEDYDAQIDAIKGWVKHQSGGSFTTEPVIFMQEEMLAFKEDVASICRPSALVMLAFRKKYWTGMSDQVIELD